MADRYTHYGIEVIHQYIKDQSFVELLEKNDISYTELPTDKWIVTYCKDGAKRYAVIEMRNVPDAYVEEVYITEAIPDDCDWDKLEDDISRQKQGEEPMKMETRLRKYLNQAIRHATDELIDEYIDRGIISDSSLIFTLDYDFPEEELNKHIWKYMLVYGYDKERVLKAESHDIDQQVIDTLLKYAF